MNAQVESAVAHVWLLTGGGIHRIDSAVAAGRFGMDDPRGARDFVALGAGDARRRENREAVEGRFLTAVPAAAARFYG